ncbi:Rpn family recombination-promoting nuclease/putative transposase [Desulfococcaceae bacterium HSG9]|nr:Rpn family recombination-promoting nuclease/putative transposase [Desulfococcaceae bacterium HSG9]
MDKTVNPHDKLFRKVWSDKAIATDFLQNYLPAKVRNHIDLNALKIAKDTFIEKELKEFYSDLLYTVDFQTGPGYVYLLFEHKSYADKLTPLQILEYMAQIWRLHLKQHPDTLLPPVIPLLLYHGRSKWKGRKFSDLMDEAGAVLPEYTPDFKYILLDLTQYSDREIKGVLLCRAVLLLFKHIHAPDFEDRLGAIFAMLNELKKSDNGFRYLEAIFRYVYSTINMSPDEIIEIAMRSMASDKGGLIMTAADRLRKEGYEQGVQQGIRQGVQDGLLEAIDLGLSLRFEDQSQMLMKIVSQINDIDRLRTIKEALKSVKDVSELRSMIEH